MRGFFNYLAGIIPDENSPGFGHFFIIPYFTAKMRFINAELDTVRGKVFSSWTAQKNTIVLRVTVPGNSTASVILPSLIDGKIVYSVEVKEVTGKYVIGKTKGNQYGRIQGIQYNSCWNLTLFPGEFIIQLNK